jgi:hypothetical protein
MQLREATWVFGKTRLKKGRDPAYPIKDLMVSVTLIRLSMLRLEAQLYSIVVSAKWWLQDMSLIRLPHILLRAFRFTWKHVSS